MSETIEWMKQQKKDLAQVDEGILELLEFAVAKGVATEAHRSPDDPEDAADLRRQRVEAMKNQERRYVSDELIEEVWNAIFKCEGKRLASSGR